jgi:DNA uptake protein ComE-like DNA-binding protein
MRAITGIEMILALWGDFIFPKPMPTLRLLVCFIACISAHASADPKPLVTLKNCTFVDTEWADGDSFQLKAPDGKLMTARLYAADCVELHINTDSDKRRLRDQRRHFGITEVKGDKQSSVSLATAFGKGAREFTLNALKRPFTVHTRYHKAPGDGKHVRYYAFVVTADGDDLASELVRAGLARAKGVGADMIDGTSRERYKAKLADLEDQAAKREKGIWKFTDWDKLPEERDVQRKEEEEDQIADGNKLPENFRLNPNTASRDDLDLLPQIGESLAEAIIEQREDEPFEKPEDLMRVPGIKLKTLDEFRQYLDFKIP